MRGISPSLPDQRVIKRCQMVCHGSGGRTPELGGISREARYAWRYAEAYRWRTVLVFWFLLSFSLAVPALAQKPSVVYIAPIDGMIDLGLAPFVERVLREADEAGAASVVLEINTFGGRVDAAVLIRDGLFNAKVPTIAFINKRADLGRRAYRTRHGENRHFAGRHHRSGDTGANGTARRARAARGRKNRFLCEERISSHCGSASAASAHCRGDGRRGHRDPRSH